MQHSPVKWHARRSPGPTQPMPGLLALLVRTLSTASLPVDVSTTLRAPKEEGCGPSRCNEPDAALGATACTP